MFTKVHARRLLKLAKFLRKLPRKLLAMEIYLGDDRKGHAHTHASIKCGTPACALGWATAVFPRDLRYDLEAEQVLTKDGHDGGQFFGVACMDDDDSEWSHLFGSHNVWRTPIQEAKAIENFVKEKLKHG